MNRRSYEGINNPAYKPENHIMETRTCACDCGGTFECAIVSNKRFINGHNRQFKSGKENPMTGKHPSEKTRKLITLSLISNSRKLNKKESKETRDKKTKVLTTRWKDPVYREATSGKNAPFYGKNHSVETRIKMSESSKKGTEHHNWKGGITSVVLKIRKSIEYKIWREAVFARDNWTCKECGRRGSIKINAHHIKPFAKFPELRFNVDNGKTLCVECHDIPGRPVSYDVFQNASLPI